MKTNVSNYTHRLLARFIIEAKTPLKIGTGEKDIMTDALVAVDVNGLPYLPGTSIAGVVRSMMDPEKKNPLFGYQKYDGGHGSEIIFSEGHVLDSKGKVVDGLLKELLEDNLEDFVLDILKYELPIRQHARIGHTGVTVNGGKFDEQVVPVGTRFCFEIEIAASKDNLQSLDNVLQTIRCNTFRLGGGTRKGLGAIEVVNLWTAHLELAADMDLYLRKSSNLLLSGKWEGWKEDIKESIPDENVLTYAIDLTAEDFLFMGSGFADPDGDADMTTVKDRKIDWSTFPAEVKEDLVLIPGSSLKGALRHRTIYHFNKQNGRFANETNLENFSNPTEVKALFGSANNTNKSRGKVVFNDIIEEKAQSKLMNHVAIDRFTGGALDGALFAEQVDYVAGRHFKTEIVVNRTNVPETAIKAFDAALKDLASGLLSLGGGVNRGHGMFTGSITKNGKEL